MAAVIFLALILVNANAVRPFAIFPKWSSIRRVIKHIVRTDREFRGSPTENGAVK